MNPVKAIVMVITFGMACVALAEDGADRTFARMEAARQSSMQAHQVAQEKKERAPVAAQAGKHTGHESC
ncbi:co-regulatory protein PtrA N-terminal domain-containing protein [Pseudomonas silesiensis]|uniref:co-regulatory protein PtrA N-terminal domain-containing protein n=1 Tax=Pseudomonas silesiensis TaxID=1853130 RepID=UPI0034D48EB2